VQKRLNRTIFKDGKVVGDEKLIQGIGRVRDVAVGPDGFIYALTEDTGLLVRLVPVKKTKTK
jgi:aldose sugar dehydrogenase